MSNSTSNLVPFVFNADDKRPLPEIIADLAGFPLAYHDLDDVRRVYAVQDWILGVAQVEDPRRFWSDMKRRAKKAGLEIYASCVQLPYRASDGKNYKMDHADAETLYQITQRMDALTGIRDQVLKYLAQAGVVVDEIRIDPDKALEAVFAYYRRMGKSDSWIDARIKSKLVRIQFTRSFKQAQKIPPTHKHYGIVTDTLRIGIWKRTTKAILTQLGLTPKDNLRDHIPEIGLIYEMLGERISTYELDQKQDLSFDAANAIVRKHSQIIGKNADEESQELGIDLVTGKPLLKAQ